MSVFLLQLLILIVSLMKRGAVSFKIRWNFFRRLPRRQIALFAAIMMVTSFASLGIKFIDQLIIGHYVNESLVGIYATSVMICAVMEIPFNAMERIASPKISYAWNAGNSREVGKIYEMSSRYMLFLGAVLFLILWSAVDVIFYFLPADYSLGKTAFYTVSIASLLNLATGVNSSVILYSGKYYMASLFLVVLLVAAIVANSLLIPVYGISGAAMATLIAIGLFNILKYVYILIVYRMQPFGKFTLLMLGALAFCLLMIVFPFAGKGPFITLVAGSLLTGVVFTAVNLRWNIIPEVNKVWKRLGFRVRMPGEG